VLLYATFGLEARAQIFDPERVIKAHGAESKTLGEDGKTMFFRRTERATPARLESLETDIAALPKRTEVFQVCDFLRGGVKAQLIAKRGEAIDVAVANYGLQGATVVCNLKYMRGNEVGTQLLFAKTSGASMYLLFVTD
jgi:hypothetical protein